MRDLDIFIEINGRMQKAGNIIGNDYRDASFCYVDEYLRNKDARPISISLPLQQNIFSVEKTKCFFEGLLPEGFSRKAVANWIKAEEEDYVSILAKLGSECLGAIMVQEDGLMDNTEEGNYVKISNRQIKELAAEGATKSTSILLETHLSLTGASGKVGLYYDEEKDEWYLPSGKMASTHIVKQSHVRLKRIVANEQFCMLVAKKLGITVPESFILDMGAGKDEEILFATKRYDRKLLKERNVSRMPKPLRLHQEDFGQALGIPASEKYEHQNNSYMKKMFDLIRLYSSNPIEDQLKLWDMIVVNFLLGNTDCHIKNFSLLYSEDLKTIRLAPAYDMVCTLAYASSCDMSFFIGGELDIRKMSRDSFAIASQEIGLGQKIAMSHFDKLWSAFPKAVKEVTNSMRRLGYKEVDELEQIMLTRYYAK